MVELNNGEFTDEGCDRILVDEGDCHPIVLDQEGSDKTLGQFLENWALLNRLKERLYARRTRSVWSKDGRLFSLPAPNTDEKNGYDNFN